MRGRLWRGGALLVLLRLRGRRDDLWDHIARAHDDYLVAVADVLAAQILLVVERRQLDRDAGYLDRLEHGEGHHAPVPAHVPHHRPQRGRGGVAPDTPRR